TLHAADLVGDGRQGVFGYSPETGGWFSATQTARGGWAEQTGMWSAGFRIAIADLDGDGRDDVVSYDPLTGSGGSCYATSPGGFKCTTEVRAPGRLFIGRAR